MWGKALTTCAKYLKALQNVNISIDWRAPCYWIGPLPSAEAQKEAMRCGRDVNVISWLLALKKVSLNTATMVINDRGAEELMYRNFGDINRIWGARIRWTLDKKKEWARFVKEVLLQPNR